LRFALGAESQLEFAKRSGIQQSALSRWINGKSTPRQDQFFKLAEALDVSVDWLALGRGEMRAVPQKNVRFLTDDELRPFGLEARSVLMSPQLDDSMVPKLRPGEHGLIDLRVREFEDDGLYAVSTADGSTMVRWLERAPDGRVAVSCANRKFDSRVLDLAEAKMKIDGRIRAILTAPRGG
jgi:transcriptional regulator with XRE-family HTH domain